MSDTTNTLTFKTRFEQREYAILKQVWRLTEEETKLLTDYFLLKANSVSLTRALIDPSDAYSSFRLKYKSLIFNVEFNRVSSIAPHFENDNSEFIISCRINRHANFYYAVVRPITAEEKEANMYSKCSVIV